MEHCFGDDTLDRDLTDERVEYWIPESSDGHAVGLLKVAPGHGLPDGSDEHAFCLEKIYLLPEYFGKGVGKALLQWVMDYAKSLSKTSIWLYVMESEGPVEVYRKAGFYVLGSTYFGFNLLKKELRGGFLMALPLLPGLARYEVSPTFRRAVPEDLPILVPLAKNLFVRAFSAQNTEEDLKKYVETAFTEAQFALEMALSDSVFTLVFVGDALVGYTKTNLGLRPGDHDDPTFEIDMVAHQHERLAELQRIYLHPAVRGTSVATLTMREAENIAREAGCAHLWLGVWEENHAALRFYEKCGFVRFGTHIFVIGDDPQTDLLLWKPLV